MGFCERVMSIFATKRYLRNNGGHEDPVEDEYVADYLAENPMLRLSQRYAIKEKRPYLDRDGYYNVYVVDSGDVEEASDEDNE